MSIVFISVLAFPVSYKIKIYIDVSIKKRKLKLKEAIILFEIP